MFVITQLATSTFLCFAYGSNMSVRRLTQPDRAPSARKVGIGYVVGRRLTFDKYGSRDHSGKCDCEFTGNPSDRVYGVIYEIDAGDRAALDDAEGLGKGYRAETLTVATADGEIEALAYVATDKRPGLPVFDWYREHVLRGAAEHGLPSDYVEAIRRVAVVRGVGERSAFDGPGDVLARPHANCYWLLPGRIIAGEYPRDFDDESSREKLRAIVSAGVTHFVDLTQAHELEPYVDLAQAEAARQGAIARYERHPIRDMGVPDVAGMRAIVDAIAANREGVTYVHCWGGIGRTGTVAGCLLVESGFTGDEAIALLARKWTVVEKRRDHPQTPQTYEQIEFIRMWKRRGQP